MTRDDSLAFDATDPLAHKRAAFALPADAIYLDGNSLGPLTHVAQARLHEVVARQWGTDLIQSWNRHHWIDLPQLTGEKIALLIGAAPGQTICCDSTSVNLFKLLAAALHLQPERRIVLTERANFPADLYIAEGIARDNRQAVCEIRAVAAEEIADALSTEVAVLLLTHVNFKTAAMHDMQALTRAAHEKGVLVVWDLAHSVGAMPLALDEWQVDFAVGCGYKYLNGGPGAPAFLYVAARHQAVIRQPLTGWMGHANPFAFAPDYEAAPGVKQMLCGTPPILAMSALDAALEVFTDVDLLQVRAKSLALSRLFLALVAASPDLAALRPASPTEDAARGSHLAFAHAEAYGICQALIAAGVIVDFRAPDILRIGITPLTLRYVDIWDAVQILREILRERRYQAPEYAHRARVT